MMSNIIILRGIILLVIFCTTWFGLALVDWMNVFNVDQISKSTDTKIGEVIWDYLEKSEEIILDDSLLAPLDTILSRLCDSNLINRDHIKMHLIKKDEVNAFAIPGGQLVVYSGLIRACENDKELTGVISHELAHIELEHVMKKLIKEVGLNVLLAMTSGGGGQDILAESVRHISSTAFDRRMEKEADLKAVDFMAGAAIDPEPFAEFLFKLSLDEPEFVRQLTWLNTHPATEDRSQYIIDYMNEKVIDPKPILQESTWQDLQSGLTRYNQTNEID